MRKNKKLKNDFIQSQLNEICTLKVYRIQFDNCFEDLSISKLSKYKKKFKSQPLTKIDRYKQLREKFDISIDTIINNNYLYQ